MNKLEILFAESSSVSNLGLEAWILTPDTDKEFEINNTPNNLQETSKELELIEALHQINE